MKLTPRNPSKRRRLPTDRHDPTELTTLVTSDERTYQWRRS
ncbi:hypothetical protein [Haladaptatus halobius]|nr:hypothetical protein [Haladaptatus halobius]